jgi:NCAIR mutase (PurE)-related protein
MDPKRLEGLLERVKSGEVDVSGALAELSSLPYKDLGYARVDHHRALRQGVPEVVWAEGKTPEQVVGVAEELVKGGHDVLITRLSVEAARIVTERVPSLTYNPVARVAKYRQTIRAPRATGFVAVVTAGTSDIPVAEEALETLAMCSITTEHVYDAGVAGIHRLLGEVERLRQARAVIVVAGMEGALASVIGGLVASPVIAVPTSIGYGVALGGLTTLFAMLTSCASGLTVVNIDNGFGAAMAVVRILSSAPVSAPDLTPASTPVTP